MVNLRMVNCECMCCKEPYNLRFLSRYQIKGKSVVLCRDCLWYLKSKGYPKEDIDSKNIITCDNCNRPHTKVDIYDFDKKKLCLICEKIVSKNGGKLKIKEIESSAKSYSEPEQASYSSFRYVLSYIVLAIWLIYMFKTFFV